MPRPVNNAKASEATPDPMEEVVLTDAVLRPESPIIRCKVIYTGPHRNKSVALKGRLVTEEFEQEDGEKTVNKQAITEGTQSYDFATHDSQGKLITQRLMPDTAPPHLRGKPFTIVEHTDHIRAFYEMRNAEGQREFEVMARAEDRGLLQDYIRRSVRGRAQQAAMFESITTGS